MSELDTMDEGEFSLADLADLDVTEIVEMRAESLPAGAYTFEIVAGTLEEGANRETQAKQFIVTTKIKVIEVKAVAERGIDKESLVGKTHVEKRYIVPGEKATEGIGYLRGFYADMGAPNGGPMGGMPGKTGFLDDAVGTQFDAKITKRPNKLDPQRPFSSLQLDAKKK